LIWLRTGTGGGCLRLQSWTFRFHKMQGVSWLVEDLLASQEGLCSVELVSWANVKNSISSSLFSVFPF
jgi:hypothetical protein